MKSIAIVVPSIRPKLFEKFMAAWHPLFRKHNCEVIVVWDGAIPRVCFYNTPGRTAKELMGKHATCLTNFNAGIRNLGFAFVAKNLPDIKVIITLDDDEMPQGDPIADHLDALYRRVPISWSSRK